jgi:hypothetical protein
MVGSEVDASLDVTEERRKVRRKIARSAFTVSVLFGGFVIALGLMNADVAHRISEMSGFLQLYFGGLYAVIMAYFGVGSYESVNAPLASTKLSLGSRN